VQLPADVAAALEKLTPYQKSQLERVYNDWAFLAKYRDANQELPAPAPGEARVVFMGDSITEGWGQHGATPPPDRAAFFPGKPYVNRGISGQTTPQMLVRFRQDVIELKPKVVVLLAGTNDIAENTGKMTLEETEGNLASMSEIARANEIGVVLCPLCQRKSLAGNTEHSTTPISFARAISLMEARLPSVSSSVIFPVFSAMSFVPASKTTTFGFSSMTSWRKRTSICGVVCPEMPVDIRLARKKRGAVRRRRRSMLPPAFRDGIAHKHDARFARCRSWQLLIRIAVFRQKGPVVVDAFQLGLLVRRQLFQCRRHVRWKLHLGGGWGCLQHLNGDQPGFHQLGPAGDWQRGAPQAVAMSACRVDVQFRRDLGILQRLEVNGRVFHVHRIVLGLHDERWRRFIANVNVGIRREVLFFERQIARIDDHGEVRPATHLICGIHGIIEALLEVRAQSRSKVGSRGEAQDTNAVRVNMPLRSVRAHDAQRALGILERSTRFRIGARIGYAVLEQHARDTRGVEPLAHFRAFQVDGQDAVAASGKNN